MTKLRIKASKKSGARGAEVSIDARVKEVTGRVSPEAEDIERSELSTKGIAIWTWAGGLRTIGLVCIKKGTQLIDSTHKNLIVYIEEGRWSINEIIDYIQYKVARIPLGMPYGTAYCPPTSHSPKFLPTATSTLRHSRFRLLDITCSQSSETRGINVCICTGSSNVQLFLNQWRFSRASKADEALIIPMQCLDIIGMLMNTNKRRI